ncbi:DUF535 family protein [Sphingomonas sp. BIUV-7]|uniref:DUF535 family protein n=1 Tax=Sphingomonas natans TaxID=3063330 RepID=A0ABT8Y4Q4_9SPHN|nr:DUF535 family protein [Sphingomonas sp. BIUV-7]MDO6413306.1 DUF535 family protein [Sphingomonas sp. BIUV-7]
MLKLWKAPAGSLLFAVVRGRPEIWGMLQAPFVSAWWEAEQRFARIIDHCRLADTLGRPFNLLPNEFVDLIDLPELAADVRIKLDAPHWMLRDGLLVLSLWAGADRIYSLAFIFAEQDGRRFAYVGGVQGRRGPSSLDRNRALTKAAYGVRPPDLLFEIFRLLCRELGLAEIKGVSDGNRHQRSDYFRERSDFVDPVYFDYDAFWRERGGALGADGFFVLPPEAPVRAEDDIPSRKRCLYRHRREMMAAIEGRLREAMSAPTGIAVQEHEPRWI